MLVIDCAGRKIEWALKKYRQKVDKCGQIEELKKRREFEKPSVSKRKIKQRAEHRSRHENTKLR